MNKHIKIPNTISEITLSYRSKVDKKNAPQILQMIQAAKLFVQHWDPDLIGFQEQLKVMLLDRKRYVIGILELAKGATCQVAIEPKLIFAAAIKANASSIIIAHNHPTGDPIPSEEDRKITAKLVKGGKFLDIPLDDHLIITSEAFFSFSDNGLLYPFVSSRLRCHFFPPSSLASSMSTADFFLLDTSKLL